MITNNYKAIMLFCISLCLASTNLPTGLLQHTKNLFINHNALTADGKKVYTDEQQFAIVQSKACASCTLFLSSGLICLGNIIYYRELFNDTLGIIGCICMASMYVSFKLLKEAEKLSIVIKQELLAERKASQQRWRQLKDEHARREKRE